MSGSRMRAGAAGTACLATALVACGEGPVTIGEGPFQLSEASPLSAESPGRDADPSVIRAADGALYVAFSSDRTTAGDVYVTRVAGGTDWAPPVRVTTSAASDLGPALLQDSQGVFHLVWYRRTASGASSIWYNRSADGMTWDPAAQQRVTPGNNFDDRAPSLAEAPDGSLIVVFAGSRRVPSNPLSSLYISRRAPGATSWAAPVSAQALNSLRLHDQLPFLARTGGQLTLTWVRHDNRQVLAWLNPESDLFQSTSEDGLTWSSPTQVSRESGGVRNVFPAIFDDEAGRPQLLWLSTREGALRPYVLPLANASAYPAGLSRIDELGSGYGHRVVWTGVSRLYLGVWVGGSDEEPAVFYRFFAR